MAKFPEKHRDTYQKMRSRINKWLKKNGGHRYAQWVLLAPDMFHLLCKLSVDPDVPTAKKAKLMATIAYFTSPLDIIPEGVVGPVGYVDDVVLTAHVLNDLLNHVDPKVLNRHWAGQEAIFLVIRDVVQTSEELVGAGTLKKLLKSAG